MNIKGLKILGTVASIGGVVLNAVANQIDSKLTETKISEIAEQKVTEVLAKKLK